MTYPPVGFHFAVTFELFPQLPEDIRFQEVSGLNVTINSESYTEGGENRFVHQLPTQTTYHPLVLKRGILIHSQLINWFSDAIENFNFVPTNVTVMLLNEKKIPIQSWYVVNAYPTQWEIGSFNAQKNELAFETLSLKYDYFKNIYI